MIYCSNCGSEIKENENFCPSCGAKLNVSEKTTDHTQSSVPPPETNQEKKEEKYTKEGRKIIDSGPHPEQKNKYVKPPVKKKKKGGCLRIFLKSILILFLFMVAGLIIIYFLPDTNETARLVDEFSVVQKGQKISENIGIKAVDIGSLEKNNIQLLIPEKTFDRKRIKIDVNEIADAPVFDTERANRIGPVYDISIDQRSKRLNKPVAVKLKLFKPENIKISHPDDLWIAYYNGKQWDYFKPRITNMKDQFIEFDTYHFCWFSTAKPTKEERINDFAKKEAVSKWTKKNNNKPTRNATEKIVKQVLLDKLGIKNKSMTQDIVESILNEGDYRKLLVSYNDNNMEQFGQDIAILAGNKIVEVLKDHKSTAKTILGGVTEHASKINTGINIVRALSDGDYENAAKELSKEIISAYPVTRLFSEAAKITERQVNRWKDDELEAAYQVFSKGTESNVPFWGYSVDSGDFDAVWDQMKGLQTQILRDGIKDYGIRHNIDVSKLGHTALNRIRRQIKEDLRKEFVKRKKEEADIEKMKEENIRLIKEFEGAHLLSKGRFGYTDQTSFDQMLRRLFLVKDMILKDTRSRVGFSGISQNGIISAKRVTHLIQLWYSSDGRQKYKEELIRLGYIADTGDIELEDGPWEIEYLEDEVLFDVFESESFSHSLKTGAVEGLVKSGAAEWKEGGKNKMEEEQKRLDNEENNERKKAVDKLNKEYKETINTGLISKKPGKYEKFEDLFNMDRYNPVKKNGLYTFTVTKGFDLEKGEKIIFVIDLKSEDYFVGKTFYLSKATVSIDYIKGKLKKD